MTEAARIIQNMIHNSHTLEVDTSPAPRGSRGRTADEVMAKMVERSATAALGQAPLPPLVSHSIEHDPDEEEHDPFGQVPVGPDLDLT